MTNKQKFKDTNSLLRRWANRIRGLYGYPVYLAGSALVKDNPRDWDVRIEMDDDAFFYRYGITAEQWMEEGQTGLWTEGRWVWADDCVKRAKDGSRQTFKNIDFQVYPKSYCKQFSKLEKFKLDTRNEPIKEYLGEQ